MPSNSVFNSQSHATRAGQSESSKVFEIEQCLYDLSKDFIRQTSLNEPSKFASNYSTLPIPNAEAVHESASTTPSTHRVHRLCDIIRHPISDEILKRLCFSEMLLVCDGNESIVGGAAINVSLIGGEVLAAFSSTRLTFLGQSTAESELMSFADRNCRPLQERKCETLVSGTTRQEKQIQLYFDDNYNITAYRQECNGSHSECFHGILKTSENIDEDSKGQHKILPDGLQLLLLRFLILSNFVGEICSQTVDVQGRVGNCIHKITAAIPAPMKLRKKTFETVKEVRKIIWFSDDSAPEESLSYYSSTGRLLMHCWNNSSYLLISNPLGTTPPTHIVELERSIKGYVEALAGLMKNHSSVKSFLEDIHSCIKEANQWNQIINPILLDLIK